MVCCPEQGSWYKGNEGNGSKDENLSEDEVLGLQRRRCSCSLVWLGFCGSFIAFSSFTRERVLVLDNELVILNYSASGSEVGKI